MGKRKREEVSSIRLPVELWYYIVHLACEGSGQGGLADINFKMAFSLALVSKRLYSLMIPLIYTHVRLTKPSDLLLYARTVSSRPCLSQHTRSLWIGPDHEHVEDKDTWPLNADATAMRASTTDPLKLPLGIAVGTYFFFRHLMDSMEKLSSTEEDSCTEGESCTEDESWVEERPRMSDVYDSAGESSTDEYSSQSRRSSVDEDSSANERKAIFAMAAEVIVDGIRTSSNATFGSGANLQSGERHSPDRSDVHFDRDEARFGPYWVQQRLDTFLAGVRMSQDIDAQQITSTTPSTTPSELHNYERYSSARLRWYIAFDRFDHPMVFECINTPSDYQDDAWDRIKLEIASDDTDYTIEIHDDIDELEASPHSHEGSVESLKHTRVSICTEYRGKCSFNLAKLICREAGSRKQPSLGALIIMPRIVLVRSPNTVSLALTSYLQKAVSGHEAGPPLERLQLLTLGPPGRKDQTPLRLNHNGLHSVQKLRLWGEDGMALRGLSGADLTRS